MVMFIGAQLVALRAWETSDRAVRSALQRLNRDERGSMTAEQAVITSVLVAAALGVLYLIYDRVIAKADTIDLDDRPPPGGTPDGGPATLPGANP